MNNIIIPYFDHIALLLKHGTLHNDVGTNLSVFTDGLTRLKSVYLSNSSTKIFHFCMKL